MKIILFLFATRMGISVLLNFIIGVGGIEMYNQTKSIKVSDITHKHLSRLGRKNESYDLIVTRLIQEHLVFNEMIPTIEKITELCGDQLISAKSDGVEPIEVLSFDEVVQKTLEIFDSIDFDYGIYPDFELGDALEIAMDEDMVGASASFGDRDLPLSEVVINCYCRYLEMPSPTTGIGSLKNPLSTI